MPSPEVTLLATQFGEVVARNAAGAVTSKLSALTARKLDQSVMNELVELVNDLIADKNELTAIAKAYEQELVAQRISESDITFITSELIPVLEQLAKFAGDSQALQAVEPIKRLLTAETLTILQLVGFNYRRAIGEPLTILVERLILNQVPSPELSQELQVMQLRREAAYCEALTDPEAREILSQS